MRTTQGTKIVKLHAVRDFIDMNADRLPGVRASVAYRRLDELIDESLTHGTDQEDTRIGRQVETRRYHALRRAVMNDHIAPIVAIARSALVNAPELQVFRMPRGNPSVMKLAAAAGGLAQAASEHAGTLIAAGLPADFAARLDDAVEAMIAAAVARTSHVARGVGARHGLVARLHDAQTVVRVLGVLVRTEAGTDDRLIDGWNAIAAPHRMARLKAAPSLAVLPSGTHGPALPASKRKLLTSGSDAPVEETPNEPGTLTTLLAPLSRIFRAS